MTKPSILMITTGGTIDAEPYDATPEMVTMRAESFIPDALRKLGAAEQCHIVNYCMKDSKDISPEDLRHIARTIKEQGANYDAVIITHGTDTMPENGRTLQRLLKENSALKIPVAITGAMTPLAMEGSDGWDSLSYAITHTPEQPADVYVAMQNTMFPVAGLRKNFGQKEFYTDEKGAILDARTPNPTDQRFR